MGGSDRSTVLCVFMCLCVCVFVFVEADKQIWIHCPAPSLCLVYIDGGGPHRISVSCVGVCGNSVIIDPATDVKPQRRFNCRPDSNNMLQPVSSMSKTTELLNTTLK